MERKKHTLETTAIGREIWCSRIKSRKSIEYAAISHVREKRKWGPSGQIMTIRKIKSESDGTIFVCTSWCGKRNQVFIQDCCLVQMVWLQRSSLFPPPLLLRFFWEGKNPLCLEQQSDTYQEQWSHDTSLPTAQSENPITNDRKKEQKTRSLSEKEFLQGPFSDKGLRWGRVKPARAGNQRLSQSVCGRINWAAASARSPSRALWWGQAGRWWKCWPSGAKSDSSPRYCLRPGKVRGRTDQRSDRRFRATMKSRSNA